MAFAKTGDDGKILMLHQLYVRPHHQGHGVGGMLLDEILNCFPEAETVRLEVEEANVRAIAFYEAYGFAHAGRTANCGGGQSGIPALVMELVVLRNEMTELPAGSAARSTRVSKACRATS